MGLAELKPEDIDTNVTAIHGAFIRAGSAFRAATSIHGFKFTDDKESNCVVRYIWTGITLLMFICASVMCATFYLDYRSNPTRLHVQNDYAPISNIYFPAVTICPEVLHNTQRAKNYIQKLKLPENIQLDEVMAGLRFNYGYMRDDEHFNASEVMFMQDFLQLNNLTVLEFMDNIRWECNDFLFRCRFHWNIEDCTQLFQVSRTFLGHCCSFNLQQSGLDFTARFARPGLREGLSIIVHYKGDFDLVGSYSYGFRVLVHPNFAYPSAHTLSKFVPLNEEVFIQITPEETFCSKAVQQLSKEERQCVFSDELELRYFGLYENSHCFLNCRVTNMVKFCGCVTFFFAENKTQDRICNYNDVPCLVENFSDIIGRFRNTQCTCPNDCETFNFDMQLTSASLDTDVLVMNGFYTNVSKDFSVIHLFLSSPVYRRVRRDLLSNTVMLVSNLGSAFSLFVGASMVSVVEIIYYFTVVWYSYYKQERRARLEISSKKALMQAPSHDQHNMNM